MDQLTKKRYRFTFALPAMIIFGLFFAVPTVLGFVLSFTDWRIDVEAIHFNGLTNFRNLFADGYFILAVKNTLIFGVATAVLKMFIGLLLALALDQPLKSKNFLRTVFYLPGVLSMIVVGIMFTSILASDGILNNFLSSIGLGILAKDWLVDTKYALGSVIASEVWKWSGFCMVIFLAGLQGIPTEIKEAAVVDGASGFKKFWNVTFPLLLPALTVNTVVNLIGGFKVFEQVYVLTGGGPGYATQVLNTYVFQAFSQGFYGKGSAMGMLLFIFISTVSITANTLMKRKEL